MVISQQVYLCALYVKKKKENQLKIWIIQGK